MLFYRIYDKHTERYAHAAEIHVTHIEDVSTWSALSVNHLALLIQITKQVNDKLANTTLNVQKKWREELQLSVW